jgi:hypothetical protein
MLFPVVAGKISGKKFGGYEIYVLLCNSKYFKNEN